MQTVWWYTHNHATRPIHVMLDSLARSGGNFQHTCEYAGEAQPSDANCSQQVNPQFNNPDAAATTAAFINDHVNPTHSSTDCM
jgi:hypothetical protein